MSIRAGTLTPACRATERKDAKDYSFGKALSRPPICLKHYNPSLPNTIIRGSGTSMATQTESNPFAAPQAAVADGDDFADTTFKLNLFSAAGRIGRVRYLGY